MNPRRALGAHVTLFVIVNTALLALWVADAGFPLGWAPAPYWPMWVHVVWGAALGVHWSMERPAPRAD